MTKFLFLFLFPCSVSAQYHEPMRGEYVPPVQTRQKEYDINRTIATGLFGFMGGVIRDDSQRARYVKQGIFVGTAISIGWGKKRKAKYILRDLGAGVIGVSLGYLVKDSLTKIK